MAKAIKLAKIDGALSEAQHALALLFDQDVYTPEIGVDANEIWSLIEDLRRKLKRRRR
jgi:hypothetical protein